MKGVNDPANEIGRVEKLARRHDEGGSKTSWFECKDFSLRSRSCSL